MKSFANPLVRCEGIPIGVTWDPFVTKHEGKYYHCYSTKDGVYVAVCDSLADLETAKRYKVYSSLETLSVIAWYAPELHRIDGVWYIYGAPRINDEGVHGMTVLRAVTDSPIGRYENIGQISPIGGKWNIDGTPFVYREKRYFAWSEGDKILLSEMLSPTTLKDSGVVVARAELPFETVNGNICEAPAFLSHGGRLFMVYSVNESGSDDYCLGMAELTGENPLDPTAWKKSPTAVFSKTEEVFGPGHCSFTEGTAPDEIYMIYHANLVSGSGWYGRHVWAQKLAWDADGFPVLGEPHR